MNRREFIQSISAAIAALGLRSKPAEAAIPTVTPELTAPAPEVASITSNGMPDGFWIIEGSQPPDADYYECVLQWWKDDLVTHRRSVRFTNMAQKHVGFVKSFLGEEARSFIREVEERPYREMQTADIRHLRLRPDAPRNRQSAF